MVLMADNPRRARQPLRRLWQILTDPRRIAHRIALEKDRAAFKETAGFLAEAGRFEEASKRLLVVSLSDWVAQAKMEVMLATALRLRGWTPTLLTFSDSAVAQSYFRASGIRRFVYFDQRLNQQDGLGRWVSEIVERLLAQRMELDSVLHLRYRDVYVGRHVLSSILRALRCSRADLEDPRLAPRLRDGLLRSVQAVHAAEQVLEAVDPQLVMFLEKGYTPYAEVFDVAVNRGLNAIQWVHSHRADALALKRYTVSNRHQHPFSLSEASWQAVREMPWTDEHERVLLRELKGRYEEGSWFSRKFLQTNKRLKCAEDVRQQLGLDPTKKTAVIFSHVLWDATFFFGENLFDDYEQWLLETVQLACDNPSVNWVIKIHPDYVWKLQAMGGGEVRDQVALDGRIGALPDHVKLLPPETDISTFSLFDVADYCLTVRGTIGIEMSCFGVPVLTAGTGRYSGLGFTIDSASRDEYLERLRHIQEIPRMNEEQIELAKKHALTLLRLRPLEFSTFEMVQLPLERLGHPLDHNVVIRAHSLNDLLGAQDLRAFAEWASESTALDYLNEAPLSQPAPAP